MQGIAYSGLHRLRKLPPDFLDTMIAMNPFDFNQLGSVRVIKDTFKLIYTLVRQNALYILSPKLTVLCTPHSAPAPMMLENTKRLYADGSALWRDIGWRAEPKVLKTRPAVRGIS